MNPFIIAVDVASGPHQDAVLVTFGNGFLSTIGAPPGRGAELARLLIPDDGKTVRERPEPFQRWVEP